MKVQKLEPKSHDTPDHDPTGHDAWVEGGEPFVGIEVMSAEQFAKPS